MQKETTQACIHLEIHVFSEGSRRVTKVAFKLQSGKRGPESKGSGPSIFTSHSLNSLKGGGGDIGDY